MRIELNSAVCGQNRFGRAENVADVALIIGDECGHQTRTLAELKERIAAEVLRRAQPIGGARGKKARAGFEGARASYRVS